METITKRGKIKRLGRPPKHGAYSKALLFPLADEKLVMIKSYIQGERLMIAPQDEPMLKMLARTLAKIDLIDRWLHEHGLFLDEGKGQVFPVIMVYWTAIKLAITLCNSIGFSPTSRIKMGFGVAQVEDLATRILKARECTSGR